MGLQAGGYLLVLTVGLLLVAPTLGCYEMCISQFSQAANSSTSLETSCAALSRHLACLQDVIMTPRCNDTMRPIVASTIKSTQARLDSTCQQGGMGPGPGPDAMNCGGQYMMCNEQFNATFAPAMNSFDMGTVCSSIANYTMCIERLLSVPACSQYASHAIGAVNSVRSRYSTLCPEPINPDGDMARCMNGTMECYTTFNNTFYPSLKKSNMTLMCSSVANYSECIQAVTSDVKCQPYTGQAMSSIQVLQRQHQTACGQDGGVKATDCLIKFKECYQHFNETFNPAVQKMDIHRLCESMDEYKVCSAAIPDDCDVFLGQSIEGLDRMQSQYSQYCTPENKKIFSCSQLSQCNRNLIGNLTMTRAESGMLCVVLESYFPCVDNAVSECMLSGDGVTAVSFRDLGNVSSEYCRSVLTDRNIKICLSFMQCHAALDLNNISPAMMVEGTYWCHYMESSLRCSTNLISAGQCNVQNRQGMLNTIGALQQKTHRTCTVTTPSPFASTTTEATTMTTPIKDEPAITREKDKSDKDGTDKTDKDGKDKTDKGAPGAGKGTTDYQGGKPNDATSPLTLNVLTLALTFITVNIFQRLL